MVLLTVILDIHGGIRAGRATVQPVPTNPELQTSSYSFPQHRVDVAMMLGVQPVQLNVFRITTMFFCIILITGCRRTTKPPEIDDIPPGGAKIDIHLGYPTLFLNIRQKNMVLERKTPFWLILAQTACLGKSRNADLATVPSVVQVIQ